MAFGPDFAQRGSYLHNAKKSLENESFFRVFHALLDIREIHPFFREKMAIISRFRKEGPGTRNRMTDLRLRISDDRSEAAGCRYLNDT